MAIIAGVLAVISLDAVARPLLERMIEEGRLPHHAELLGRGHTYALTTTPIHASIYRSLYTGCRMSTHGVHYPLQWCADEQCVKPADGLNPDDSIFTRLERAGRRMLVIDPPECGVFTPRSGVAMSGWQFTTRFVLPRWDSSPAIARALEYRFGRSMSCNEVFGRPSPPHLRAMHGVLQSAPQRLVDATLECLKTGEFDFLWVTFVAAHIAGHQLWRESIDAPPAGGGREPALLAGIYEKVDEALGRLLAALPPNTDLLIFSGNGMGPETSLADLLPALLARVLAGTSAVRRGAGSSPVWRLRAAVPTRVRARVADALPDRTALRLAARLEGTGINWRQTRAFAPPSDGPGFVRLNLKGRERDGIVDAAAAESLLDEIAAGLQTFVDPSGDPIVASVWRSSDLDAPGSRSHVLPDLIVGWTDKPAVALRAATSPVYGEVRRHGVGSGRAGNHPGPTWAAVIPGQSRVARAESGPLGAIDLAATVCAAMDVPHADLPGRPLLE
jgi:predicted AlkP superfamily phosphohydrolase/phosphomutase